MIPHVAEAGEERGRVVLEVVSGRPSLIAIEAAIRVAQAFNSEIESLFVEDRELIALAAFPFAREISPSGNRTRSLTTTDIEQDLRAAASAAIRIIERMAREVEIPVSARIVRSDRVEAAVQACAERGPWNVVTLAEPFQVQDGPMLRRMLEEVGGATGVIIVGPRACRTSGPIVIAAESAERLPGMLVAAERLAPITGGEAVLVLIGEGLEQLELLDAQARLVLGERDNFRIEPAMVPVGAASAVAEILRRIKAGFVIAELGGCVVPGDDDLRPLAIALECPLFLVR